jgi:hypothetical protein
VRHPPTSRIMDGHPPQATHGGSSSSSSSSASRGAPPHPPQHSQQGGPSSSPLSSSSYSLRGNFPEASSSMGTPRTFGEATAHMELPPLSGARLGLERQQLHQAAGHLLHHNASSWSDEPNRSGGGGNSSSSSSSSSNMSADSRAHHLQRLHEGEQQQQQHLLQHHSYGGGGMKRVMSDSFGGSSTHARGMEEAPKPTRTKKKKKSSENLDSIPLDDASESVDDDMGENGDGSNRDAKRQMRLVKNRQAAQQFRKRQKQYIQDLEKRCSSLTAQNASYAAKLELLITENRLVKEQLEYLRSFVNQAVQVSLTPAAATGGPLQIPGPLSAALAGTIPTSLLGIGAPLTRSLPSQTGPGRPSFAALQPSPNDRGGGGGGGSSHMPSFSPSLSSSSSSSSSIPSSSVLRTGMSPSTHPSAPSSYSRMPSLSDRGRPSL